MAVSPCPLRAADSERLFGCKISSNTGFLSRLERIIPIPIEFSRMRVRLPVLLVVAKLLPFRENGLPQSIVRIFQTASV